MTEVFVMQQSKKLSGLKYATMTKAIQKLTQSKNVQKLDACSIISVEDPLIMYRDDYLVCAA